jgi:hypothetical protein
MNHKNKHGIGGICARHKNEIDNVVVANLHLIMQTLTFVHIHNKPKRIGNMNLVIQFLNLQNSNLLPKNALQICGKAPRRRAAK